MTKSLSLSHTAKFAPTSFKSLLTLLSQENYKPLEFLLTLHRSRNSKSHEIFTEEQTIDQTVRSWTLIPPRSKLNRCYHLKSGALFGITVCTNKYFVGVKCLILFRLNLVRKEWSRNNSNLFYDFFKNAWTLCVPEYERAMHHDIANELNVIQVQSWLDQLHTINIYLLNPVIFV